MGSRLPAVCLRTLSSAPLRPFLVTWGAADGAGLGTGRPPTAAGRLQPAELPLNSLSPSRIAAGYAHSLICDEDGQLYGTGLNTLGQLGQFKSQLQAVASFELPQDPKIVHVAAGRAHSLALDAEGRLFGTGLNSLGQLAMKRDVVSPEDAVVKSWIELDTSGLCGDVIDVQAGQDHSLVVTQDEAGTRCWSTGWGADGQTGLGHCETAWTWTEMEGSAGATSINSRSDTTLITFQDRLAGCGNNEYEQLAQPAQTDRFPSLTTLAHASFSGAVYAFGLFLDGKTYKGESLSLPFRAKSLAAGSQLVAAIDDKGQLWAASVGHLARAAASVQDGQFAQLTGPGFRTRAVACGQDYGIAVLEQQ